MLKLSYQLCFTSLCPLSCEYTCSERINSKFIFTIHIDLQALHYRAVKALHYRAELLCNSPVDNTHMTQIYPLCRT